MAGCLALNTILSRRINSASVCAVVPLTFPPFLIAHDNVPSESDANSRKRNDFVTANSRLNDHVGVFT